MTYYWAEVKRVPRRKKYQLLGLHESSGFTKPYCTWGGDNCIAISEKSYLLLNVFNGDIRHAQETIRAVSDLFVSDPAAKKGD